MSLPLFTCRPIGIIHTPHTDPAQTPRQPIHAADFTGQVEIFPEFAAGLEGLATLCPYLVALRLPPGRGPAPARHPARADAGTRRLHHPGPLPSGRHRHEPGTAAASGREHPPCLACGHAGWYAFAGHQAPFPRSGQRRSVVTGHIQRCLSEKLAFRVLLSISSCGGHACLAVWNMLLTGTKHLALPARPADFT